METEDALETHRQKLMVIEINYGKGKTGEILVHYGDDPLELAQAFARKHNLKSSSVGLVKNHVENTIADFLANAHANADEQSPDSSTSQRDGKHSESESEPESESVASPPSTAAQHPAELPPPSPVFSPDVAVRVSGLARDPDAPPIDPQQFGLSPVPPSDSAPAADTGGEADAKELVGGQQIESHFAEDSELDMSYHSALEQQLNMDETSFIAQSRDDAELEAPEPGPSPGPDPSGTSEEGDAKLEKLSSPQLESKPSEITSAASSVTNYRVVYEHGAFVRDKPSRNANNLRLLDSGDVVAVTGKSFTNQENGVQYLELDGGGWVPFRTQAGHIVLELQANNVPRGGAIEAPTPPGDNPRDRNDNQDKPPIKEKEVRQGDHKRRLQERVMQRQKTDDSSANAESAAVAENARLKLLLVEQQRALEQAQSATAAAERAKVELEKAAAASKAAATAELEAATASAREAAIVEARALAAAIKEAEEAAEIAAEQQRLKEKAEHEQWLAEQRSVDVMQGTKTLDRTEELYNRMRAATSAATSAKITMTKTDVTNAAEMSSISIESLGFDPAALKVSTSFALTTKDASMKATASVAHDRLHRAAAVRIQNRVNMRERLDSRDAVNLTRNRFTMNTASKNIMENVKHATSRVGENGEKSDIDSNDFLHRMYEDGRKAQMQRKKVADVKEQAGLEPYKIEEWSCARCGVFHTIDHKQLTELQREAATSHRKHAAVTAAEGQGLPETKEATRKANTDAIQAAVKYHSKLLRCSRCGFERQDAIAPHKPLNIALQSAEENGTATQLLARRAQAIESSGGMFEYLRSNHLHAQGQLARQRREWDRKDQMLTFQPRINDISHQLVESKIQLCKAIESLSLGENISQNSLNRSSASLRQSTDVGLRNRNASPTRTNASASASLGNNGPFGNSSTSGHKIGHLDSSLPSNAGIVNANVMSQETARVAAAERHQQPDRAAWLLAHTIQNKKLENSISYSHDSKPTSVSEYFQQTVAARLSANIKPHIVKRKHENKNKYIDHVELYTARKAATLALEVEESKGSSDEEGASGLKANDSASSDAHLHFVARQILWQRKNHASKDKLRHQLHDYDQSTQRLLYRPHVDPSPNNSFLATEPAMTSGDIVHRLSAKDLESKRRRAALVQDHLRLMEREQKEKKVAALPQSTDILAKATERSITDMFKSLLNSVGSTAEGGAEATPTTGEKDGQLLNLSLVQPKTMAPEAAELLLDVISERERKNSANAEGGGGGGAWRVSSAEFRQLLLGAIERRGKDPSVTALGRSYMHVTRKRPVVATKKAEEDLAQLTFTPAMDKGTTAILRNTGRIVDTGVNRNKQPVEAKLLNQGRKMEGHKEELRKKKEEQDKKTFTFRPQLFKPPKNVVPHYRGTASAAPAPTPVQVPEPVVATADKEQSIPPFKPVLSGKTLAKVTAALRSPPRLAVNAAVPAAVSYTELYGRSPKRAPASIPDLPPAEAVASARPPPPPFPVELSNAQSGGAFSLADSFLEMVKPA